MDSAGHVVQAERIEAFLKTISSNPYQEWAVTGYYYASLHYIDAFLVKQRRKTWGRHDDRLRVMDGYQETQAISTTYETLEKLSREARYNGTPFTAADVTKNVAPLFQKIRAAMRGGLSLP